MTPNGMSVRECQVLELVGGSNKVIGRDQSPHGGTLPASVNAQASVPCRKRAYGGGRGCAPSPSPEPSKALVVAALILSCQPSPAS